MAKMTGAARVTAARMADAVQRPDAARFNLRILGRIARSHYRGDAFLDAELPALARHLVHHTEAGTLSSTDSLIVGAYAVATLRECAS
jgi:hypothetical protein